HMPMLEPSSVQECKDFVISAFEISEKLKVPVILRVTTRSCYAKGTVELGKIKKAKKIEVSIEKFKEAAWNNMPPKIVEVHKNLHEKLKLAENISEKFCKIEGDEREIGIIVSGIPYLYVKEVFEDEELKGKAQILKIGMWPYPKNKIKNFLLGKKKVLVIEEIEGILEEEIKKIAYEENLKVEILGKNILPSYGELKINDVEAAIRKVLELKKKKYKERLDVIPRRPVLCPGCPHRATFYEIKKVFGNAIYCGDVGCYILGMFRPLETQGFIISMGASEGIAHGIKKVRDDYVISFVGDSTFFHAGIPGLINIVYNQNYNVKNNPLVVIMNNKATAMTGHQPHPGVGITGMGNKVNEIKIEEISKFCNTTKIDPFNYKESLEKIKKVKDLLEKEPQVIISEKECRLQFMRRARREGIRVPTFYINKEKCKK
ncbi:MAG: thiamine pyrophosphate-dependent enzyme, partial [Candidatus Micrarchaeia archaeon]